MDTLGAADPIAARVRPDRFSRWAENALLFFLLISGIAAFVVIANGPPRFTPVVVVAAALSIGVLVTSSVACVPEPIGRLRQRSPCSG